MLRLGGSDWGGSLSKEVVVFQSITAGCSMAKLFLQVLCYRSMVRVGELSIGCTLRVFVDDSGNQWQGEEPDKIWQLQESTDMWEEEVEKLKLFDSVDKRALLLTHKSMLQFIRGFQAYKRIISKSQHTYLGFDIFSGSPFAVGRKTSSKRLGGCQEKNH